MTMPASHSKDAQPKAITLLGMSGVGKTYLSAMLENAGWHRISCDYEIGHRYLAPYLQTSMQNADDIDGLARFVGLVGAPELGGLPLDTFKERQNLYYEAECTSIRAALSAGLEDTRPLVIDSTGSLCEIEDTALIDALGQKTLFVYLQASEEEEQAVLRRAQTNPKPLFYPPSDFPAWLSEYMEREGIAAPEQINPKEFARSVFPRLFASRLPKYEAFANRYGVTIPTSSLRHVKTADDFLSVIAEACT